MSTLKDCIGCHGTGKMKFKMTRWRLSDGTAPPPDTLVVEDLEVDCSCTLRSPQTDLRDYGFPE